MQDFAIEQVELSQRLAMSQARMEAAALARKEQSRADRKAGRLTEGVVNGLRACTIPQLVRAKKLCDEFIWDQRHAHTTEGGLPTAFYTRSLAVNPFPKSA